MFVNSRSKMNTLPTLVAAWTAEAIEKHGFDWKEISAYLRGKIASLPPEEKGRLEQEAMITAFERSENARKDN
jgi:hypothetical protein